MTMKIGTRILAGYFIGLLVFGLVGVVSYRSTTDLMASADTVTHSHQVKEALSAVRFSFVSAETGQRGFVLTGEDRYLDSYRTGTREVDGNLARLRELTADNPSQQRKIDQLQQLAAAKLSELAETIDLRRQKGEQAAVAVVLTDRGKNAMDEIRRVIAEMDNEETGLLRDQDDRAIYHKVHPAGGADRRFAGGDCGGGGAAFDYRAAFDIYGIRAACGQRRPDSESQRRDRR
jgi:CHASE3 domain sensor protein